MKPLSPRIQSAIDFFSMVTWFNVCFAISGAAIGSSAAATVTGEPSVSCFAFTLVVIQMGLLWGLRARARRSLQAEWLGVHAVVPAGEEVKVLLVAPERS